MSADQIENELVRKVTGLQQEVREHELVLDAFKLVEPTRKCFHMIGGVLVERTVKEVQPVLEENVTNIQAAIGNLNDVILKRREQRKSEINQEDRQTTESNTDFAHSKQEVSGTAGVLA
jgi:prefoldin subunit 2